ncbi:hypothetical protein ZIOFF_042985 [Zingiber officinale]|uniref:O-fucosyltransferase family protein n=1 Tax=Zingiber officinale TaxID=94328 RepID=A0A8J5G2N7_ZINOF|nr:hypothetical protein ZIOFF_042985 [Zingiber officinale]
MVLRRRRRPDRRVAPASKFLSAAALLFLLVLAFRCFLALSSLFDRHRPPCRSNSSCSFPSGGESRAMDLWASETSKDFYGCSHASIGFSPAGENTLANRYLVIATSGGLNQQRTGVIKQLPENDGEGIWSPHTMRVPRKCSAICYQTRVLPVFMKKNVVKLTKFDYRLANQLETDLQKLRCRVNYHSLKFTDQIQNMGDKLIHRMNAKGNDHFIALHLRFEADMLAFSGCYYGGGERERTELGAASNPEKERRHGKCPLKPEEVGLMLKALGFGRDAHLYVASGEIYGGEERLAPLKALFPNLHSKETLATEEELAPFSSYSSRMAALDFIVCDGGSVFVANNNGNMAKILAGRRRYFGHKRTIRPNAKKLHTLFLNVTDMPWETFSSRVRAFQKGFMGEPNEETIGRGGGGGFHENPSACICEKHFVPYYLRAEFDKRAKRKGNKSYGEVTGYFSGGDKNLGWTDLDYEETESPSNGTDLDYDELI